MESWTFCKGAATQRESSIKVTDVEAETETNKQRMGKQVIDFIELLLFLLKKGRGFQKRDLP
jgi:hypothetical protein